MSHIQRWFWVLLLAGWLSPFALLAQIDPVPRKLFQLGYNAAFEGHAPLSGYAFYYWNQPGFLRTNLTIRLAVAPTYLDSELGIRGVLDKNTDLGIGVAGGGYADSYDEIKAGTYIPSESFSGYGAETSLSLYHCFNPDSLIPLNGVLRGSTRYILYDRNEETAPDFRLPEDRGVFTVRTGLRWGGKEPMLFPSLAMELSIWYEGRFRSNQDAYGYATNQFRLQAQSQLFWGTALLAYTFTNSGQGIYLNLTAGTSLEADRFSAYRLGALLPMVSEFPLSLPGYYYQEISADRFVLLAGNYILPLDKKKRWNINLNAATAGVNYLGGMQQPGNWLSGVGGGILYQSTSLKVMAGYAYGIDAIRDGGRGANSIGVLLQFDLERAKEAPVNTQPGYWRGLQRIFGVFGD